MNDEELIIKVSNTLNLQEAQTILRMRELPWQKLTIYMENGKVVRKEQVKSIKE